MIDLLFTVSHGLLLANILLFLNAFNHLSLPRGKHGQDCKHGSMLISDYPDQVKALCDIVLVLDKQLMIPSILRPAYKVEHCLLALVLLKDCAPHGENGDWRYHYFADNAKAVEEATYVA